MIYPKKILSYKEALEYLKTANLIVNFGTDHFYLEQIRNKTISLHKSNTVIKIDAKEVADFLDQLMFKDLFGVKRIFIIEHFNEIDNVDYFIKNDFEDIIILEAEKINQTKIKKFLGKALIIESKLPPVWEEESKVLGKILGFFKSKNYEIEDSAAKYLYNHIGYNLYKLSSELQKLLLFKDAGSKITKNDIDAVGISNTKFNIFDLINYLIDGNKKEALTLLDKVFRYENSPSILLISLWNSHFEKLLYIKTTTKKNSDIAEYLGIPIFVIEKKLKPQADKLSTIKLLCCLKILSDFDLKIKHNSFDLKFYFEKFILDF